MSARPFETHNHAANAHRDRRLYNLKPIFKTARLWNRN